MGTGAHLRKNLLEIANARVIGEVGGEVLWFDLLEFDGKFEANARRTTEAW